MYARCIIVEMYSIVHENQSTPHLSKASDMHENSHHLHEVFHTAVELRNTFSIYTS